MRLLIKLFLFFLILILIAMYFRGDFFLEKAGTYILNTTVEISKVKFIPRRFAFKLYGIDLPKKNILFPTGSVFLFPPKLELYGLKFKDKILLNKKNFSGEIFWRNNWQVGILFKGVDLTKFGHGFEKGVVSGTIDGSYTGGNLGFYGLFHLNEISYSDSESSFLGISSEEFQKLIDMHNGHLELDFTYKGPIDKIDELYRYRPGKKTMSLVRDYLIQNLQKVSK